MEVKKMTAASRNRARYPLQVQVIEALKKLVPQSLRKQGNYWNELFECTIRRRFIERHEKPFAKLVSKFPPYRILEIGVARGWGAERMAKAAGVRSGRIVEYYGFCLFNDCTVDEIQKKLEKLGVKKIRLFKGDSQKTLPQAVSILPKMDFIYIDGCHDGPWVESDWRNAQLLMHDDTIVVFDNYGMDGVKRVVDAIKEYQIGFLGSSHTKAIVSRSFGDELSPPLSRHPIPFPLVQGEPCNPWLMDRRRWK